MIEDLPVGKLKRLLSWVGFLEPLSEGQLGELARRITCGRIEAGEVLAVEPEEHGQRMLLLLVGQAQVYETNPSGREFTFVVLEGGTFVGATGLVPRHPRELRIRALKPSVVCHLDRQDLAKLVRRNPEVGLRLAHLLGRQLVSMEGRLWDLAQKEVPARLASMILRLVETGGVVTPKGYRLPTRYTHQQLDTMIGAQREAVTRAFGELRRGGGVELRNRYIHVTDVDALERLAESGQ